MKKLLAMTLLFCFLAASPLSALTVKLGSLFPEGSSWDMTLKKMAAEWSEITGGRVKIKIYPGGIAGDEADMVRKMRIGQLDCAVLTGIGMTEIVPDSMVVSLPFFIRNNEEFDFVIDEVMPEFNDDFNDKGFEVLVWSNSGFVSIFSNSPVLTPDDLRRTKLATTPDSTELTEAFKALDFKVIPLPMNDTLMGLQSGMIDSFYSIPMAAAAYQWFALANYYNPVPLAPVIGGVVMSERTWRKIPSRYHEELKESMARVEQDFYNETVRLNNEAMKVMLQHDLKVLEPSEADAKAWQDLFKDGYWMIVGDGKGVSEETFNMVHSRLEEFRK